jgi:hypothetical protein
MVHDSDFNSDILASVDKVQRHSLMITLKRMGCGLLKNYSHRITRLDPDIIIEAYAVMTKLLGH